MQSIRTLAAATLAAAALALASGAHAHGGGPAKHGGIVKESNDMHYELVAKSDGAELYVEDHGEPVPTAKFTGKLTVLNGTAKSEAALVPAGGNKLEAKGVKVGPGAKVIAALVAGDGVTRLSVRFAIP